MSPIRNLFDSVERLTWFLGGSAKRKEIFLEMAFSRRDDQQLPSLLIEADAAGDLSESAQAIKEGRKRKQCPGFVLLVGQPESVPYQLY